MCLIANGQVGNGLQLDTLWHFLFYFCFASSCVSNEIDSVASIFFFKIHLILFVYTFSIKDLRHTLGRYFRMLLERGMGNGEWRMGSGEWRMGNEEWGKGKGKGNGEWGMKNGEREKENEEWGMGKGK